MKKQSRDAQSIARGAALNALIERSVQARQLMYVHGKNGVLKDGGLPRLEHQSRMDLSSCIGAQDHVLALIRRGYRVNFWAARSVDIALGMMAHDYTELCAKMREHREQWHKDERARQRRRDFIQVARNDLGVVGNHF